MEHFNLDFSLAQNHIEKAVYERFQSEGLSAFQDLCHNPESDAGNKGWLLPMEQGEEFRRMMEKAKEVRENADLFLLVGVGGSKNAAYSVIHALQRPGTPEVLYAGNTLSAPAIRKILDRLPGRSVYINVIAKNFETLEPGSHFRVLREALRRQYSESELSQRIIVTGSRGSRLEEIARENSYTFLEFPMEIGGRYSAFSPVGLFPMAVAGLDVEALLNGAEEMKAYLMHSQTQNIAVNYAAYRRSAYEAGKQIEVLGFFEPQLEAFSKWWIQLYGESEGKEKQGIFPSAGSYSEELHSLGQFMQDGSRNLLETFLIVQNPDGSVVVSPDDGFHDGFDYLNGMDFNFINHCAEAATIHAHTSGGVPCARITVDKLEEAAFGRLFYFFMISCAVSGKLFGINPFNQEGVEEYKRSMFRSLKEPITNI